MSVKKVSVRTRMGAAILFALMLFMCVAVHSSAIAEGGSGVISVNMNEVERLGNKSNIVMALYKVGQPDMNSSTGWSPTSAFASVTQTGGFPPFDNMGRSRLLDEIGSIIQRNHLQPFLLSKTAANGIARFTGLDYGIYYLCVYYSVSGIDFSPCLLAITPQTLNVSINAKYSYSTADTTGPYSLFVDYVYESTGEPAADTYSDTLDEGDNYSVKSPKVTGYTPTIQNLSGTMPSHSVVYSVLYSRSNTPSQDVGGTVTWVGDTPELRPNSVTIVLMKDGEVYSSEPTWEKNGDVWTYTFEDVPIYSDDGVTPAEYTVVAEDINYYNKTQDGMDIVYSVGSQLPSTGSYGVLMCYMVGAAIIVCSLAAFRKKRGVLLAVILVSMAAVSVFAPVFASAELREGVLICGAQAPEGIHGNIVFNLYKVGHATGTPGGYALDSRYSIFPGLLSSVSSERDAALQSVVTYIRDNNIDPNYQNITMPINDPSCPSIRVEMNEGVYVWIVTDYPDEVKVKNGMCALPDEHNRLVTQIYFKLILNSTTPEPTQRPTNSPEPTFSPTPSPTPTESTPPGPPTPTPTPEPTPPGPPTPTPTPEPTPPGPPTPTPTPQPTPDIPPTMEFTLYKIDSRETVISGSTSGHEILDGAEFELYSDAAGTQLVTLYLTSSGYSAVNPNEDVPPRPGTPVIVVPSTTIIEAGQARIYDLPVQSAYYLKEVTAPSGYQKTNGLIPVSMRQSGSGVVQTVSGVDYLISGGVAVENEYQITGEELPETGGEGTAYIYGIGALLLVIAFVWLNLRRQKRA